MIKVGDKVRIKKFSERPSHWNNHGEMDKWMGKVMTVKDKVSNRFFMEEDKCERPISGWAWRESDFVKVEEETMTKSDLKDGMICVQRDGTRFMWLNGALRGINLWGDIEHEDLTGNCEEDDVMVVYSPVGEAIGEMLKHDYSQDEPIWERVEPRKMTHDEIKRELGYDFEEVPE